MRPDPVSSTTRLDGDTGLAGMIYTKLLDQGLIAANDRLEQYLPVHGTAVGRITLQSCLTHTSGLPREVGGRCIRFKQGMATVLGRDPQPQDVAEFMRHLREATVTDAGVCRYSNVAGAALGHALAAAAGVDYPALVQEHLATALACPTLRVEEAVEHHCVDDAVSYTVFGGRARSWTGRGYAPAGAIRGSAQDFATILTALLVQDGPFQDCFKTLHTDSKGRVAAGFFVDKINGRDMAWHSGFAAGFASHLIIDLERCRGAFVSVITPTPTVDVEVLALETLESDG